MLELLLLRHGEAAFSLPDSDRNLTERGIVQSQQVLHKRADSLNGLTGCYVSPYRRARQTAQLVQQQVELSAAPKLIFQIVDGLQPDCSVDALIEWLQPQQGRVLLVAHNPLLTLLLNRLLGGPDVGLSSGYQFGTSTLASVSMPVAAAGCAELNWISYPE